MNSEAAHKTSFFKAIAITKRDLRVFGLTAFIFTSVALGAVTLAQPAHGQSADICSSAKYFN